MGHKVRAFNSAVDTEMDVRVEHREEDGTIVLDELLIGGLGLWRRLRGPGADDRGVAWENVVEIDDAFLTVRGS